MKKLILISPLILLCGCSTWFSTVNQNQPHTTFKVALGTASVSYQSPKDVIASNVDFYVTTNGTTHLTIGSISAIQDTNSLSETAQALTAQGEASVNQMNSFFNGMASLGVSAAKSAK